MVVGTVVWAMRTVFLDLHVLVRLELRKSLVSYLWKKCSGEGLLDAGAVTATGWRLPAAVWHAEPWGDVGGVFTARAWTCRFSSSKFPVDDFADELCAESW